VRRELGKDISASCGQLKKSVVKGEWQCILQEKPT
jgi:adenine C2-methylase RlmN of 23S rRNA A2503 and tRNA A37